MFYNLSNLLSRNSLFNFIIGNRGCGKSFALKKHAINCFLKNNSQFIYLRRYKTELKNSAPTFFNDISSLYPEHKFTYKNSTFYIDGKCAGYAFNLSTSITLKSMSFPNVSTIIFDEFLIMNSCYHYLSNEVLLFLEFYETIARMRDVKVFFLANAITQTNPYFNYFNIKLTNKQFYLINNLICIEIINNKDYITAKKSTKFGQLIANTSYNDYAIENNFINDSNSFIAKLPPKSTYFFTLHTLNYKIGIWYNNDKLYCSHKYDSQCPFIFTSSSNLHDENHTFSKPSATSSFWNKLYRSFCNASLYFEDINIKNTILEELKIFL